MFEYDDNYCYVGGRDSQQISKNKLILSEIINELQLKVSSDTPYYKVLCPQNKIDYLEKNLEQF